MQIRCQPGPQEQFLSTSADIAFYGGAAGGGKTYGLLLEALRHISTTDGFGVVIFRRTTKQIMNEGGLWDTSNGLYPHLGARPRESLHDWQFPPYSNKVKFAHMEHEKNRLDWDGSQVPMIGYDQLEQFTRKMFFYMLSRNRSACGIRPYIRGNYNPVPPDDEVGGWLHEFVGWYIDEDGYPVPERSGTVRWFVNLDDHLHWYDDEETAVSEHPDIEPKSFTYIMSTVYDNKILLKINPGYLANLKALNHIEQERLLRANHLIKAEAGKVFNRAWFEVVDALPPAFDGLVRFWDLAASAKKQKGDPDFTAGVLMGVNDGVYYIIDVRAEQLAPAHTDRLLKNTATQDGRQIRVRWEEEGGASGKRDSLALAILLAGWDARGVRPQGDKLTRSRSLAAQTLAGNVKVFRASWTEMFLTHMHNIPDGAHDDIHDASAGAFNELSFMVPARAYHGHDEQPVEISMY